MFLLMAHSFIFKNTHMQLIHTINYCIDMWPPTNDHIGCCYFSVNRVKLCKVWLIINLKWHYFEIKYSICDSDLHAWLVDLLPPKPTRVWVANLVYIGASFTYKGKHSQQFGHVLTKTVRAYDGNITCEHDVCECVHRPHIISKAENKQT